MDKKLSRANVDRLLKSLFSQLGTARFIAFGAPVIGEAEKLIESRDSQKPVNVYDDADEILSRIGDQLPEIENIRDVVAAILLDVGRCGGFGGDGRNPWAESN